MLLETISIGFKLALVNGNSSQAAFQSFAPLGQTQELPTQLASQLAITDGTHKAGWLGQFAQNRVKIMPWGDQPGASFSLRLWIWREGTNQQGASPIWVPEFLAELACTTGTVAGPAAPGVAPSPYMLPDSGYLCDTIALTQGVLGLTGLINSTGPGTNLFASAVAEIVGARYFTFDFQPVDPVNMNALWCFC